MAKDFGNTLKTATQVSFFNRQKNVNNTIGPNDRFDFLRLSLKSGSTLKLALSGLNADVNLAIFNKQGKLLKQSTQPGKQNDNVEVALTKGTYFIRVDYRKGGSTNYRLSLTKNTPPTLVRNAVLKMTKGGLVALNGNYLLSKDAEQGNRLIYTLTDLPQNGSLLLNGIPLKIGGRFTQADINSGRLRYKSAASLTPLSQNTTGDVNPQVSGSSVVWQGRDSNDSEIYFYNGNKAIPLTNNNTNDISPQTWGSRAVW